MAAVAWVPNAALADQMEKPDAPVVVPQPTPRPAPAPAPAETPPPRMRYVPPITQPIFNEPAEITTELRPIFLYHRIPNNFVSDGGRVIGIAVQARAAITDRLAFIATKDGYTDINFDSVLPDEEGFLNIAAGLKYAVYAKPDAGRFVTLGLRYEAPIGDLETAGIKLQGGGDGMLDGFVTATTALGDKAGLQGSIGYDGAIDTDHDSSFLHASVHGDYEVVKNLFGVLEFNMQSTLDRGNRTDGAAVGSFEGFDVFNFGNTQSGTVVTAGFGARWRAWDHLIFGAAYELPLDRKDVIQDRVTVDAVLHF
jgi:hypothetical protein